MINYSKRLDFFTYNSSASRFHFFSPEKDIRNMIIITKTIVKRDKPDLDLTPNASSLHDNKSHQKPFSSIH